MYNATDYRAISFAHTFNSWSNLVEFKWDKIFLVYSVEDQRIPDPTLVFKHNNDYYGITCYIPGIAALYTYLTTPERNTHNCRLFPLPNQLITELAVSTFVESYNTIEELIEIVHRYSTLEVL